MTDLAPNSNRSDGVPGGLQDDPGASQLQDGEFGLDGDLRAHMLAALEQKWNADDPGSTQLDDLADTDDPPDPAPPSTSTATPPAAPVEDGAGAGEGAAPVDPDPGTPSSTSPPPDPDADFSLDAYAQEYFGTRLTRDQSRNLFATLNGLQNLTPAQREELDRVLAGGAPNQYPATTGQPVSQAPVNQPAPPANNFALPPRPPDDDYEGQRMYDQYIAPLANATAQQLAQINDSIAQTTRVQQQQAIERDSAVIESAATGWRSEHPILSDGEYDALTDRIARSGTFPALISAHRGDIAAATRAALEQHFWSDPTFRDRAIANIASGRAAGDPNTPDPTSPVAQASASADIQRQARAGSVAGGGGAQTPRGTTPPPKDAAGRRDALVAAIAAEGDFS